MRWSPPRVSKISGRIGFLIGFIGPVLFYSSPPGTWTYESHLVCPPCPYIDIPFMNRMDWLALSLEIGLLFGLVYASAGFAIGLIISKLRKAH